MFTRRTATVTMSAPEAACACAITGCEGYLPVPTISREANVRPAMTNGVSVMPLAATHEIHDFDPVAVVHQHLGEPLAPDDGEVVLDRDPSRIDVEPLQQRGHRQ